MRFLFLAIACCLLLGQAQAQFNSFCPGQNTTGYVVELVEHNNQLYATGLFSRICGKLIKSVARWDGAQWNALTNETGGVIDAGHAMTVIGGKLYLAKYEWNQDSNWLVRIEQNTMRKILPGFWRTNPNPNLNQVPILYDVLEYKQQIVVSGEFDRVGNQSIQGVARYTGSGWAPLAEGLTGYLPNTYNLIAPHGMFVWNDNLLVAGNFLKAGKIVANGVGRWDGTQWYAMGEGFNKAAYGFGTLNGELYACGEFTASGNTPLGGIAKWDGNAWVDPGFGFVKSTPDELLYVHTLQEINGKLYVLGGFKKVVFQGDTLACSAIVVFDGSTLDLLGGGLPNLDAEAIIPYRQGILVGGGIVNGSTGYIGAYGDITDAHTPETEPAVVISPNPVSDKLHLKLPTAASSSFQIFNALGQTVLEGTHTAADPEIDMSNQASGVYFLVLRVGGRQWVERVVRE